MALDPSVILQAGRGVTPLLSLDDIQEQRAQRELSSYKLQSVRQGLDDDRALRDITRSTPTNALASAFQRAGFHKQSQDALKFEAEQGKTRADQRKTEVETAGKLQEAMGGPLRYLSENPTVENASRVFQHLSSLGIMKPEQIQSAHQQIQSDSSPEGIRRFAMLGVQAAINAEKQATLETQRRTQEEASRHNRATEVNSTGLLDVARGNLGVNQQRAATEANQPKGQVVQSADGPVLVDPRTGTSRPVLDATGNPARRPGKDIPASINKSIIENQQTISKIEKAIAAIEEKPGSLGTMYMLPGADTVGQYLDPEGVEARAGVADIGSLTLHDRSGAAVTASETPRLRPFIPSASDRPEEALKKLKRFKAFAEEEAGLLAQTYGADQGYKESPILRNATTPKTDGARTVSAADVDATARASGRSVDEVRKAMKAKGWKVQ